MPKRRRLLTTVKKRSTPSKYRYSPIKEEHRDSITSSPRGRLKGALKDVLDPVAAEDSDEAYEPPVTKRLTKIEIKRAKSETESSEDEASDSRTPYVLKLFDRSVDLSQFTEDSPLYPICRAWIANQPKLCYKKFGKQKFKSPELDEGVELPGPEGPPVSRVPKLLPEQEERNKDNINLNYEQAPPPSAEYLLSLHCARWACVRRAWLQQSARVEERYSATQELLNKINVFTN